LSCRREDCGEQRLCFAVRAWGCTIREGVAPQFDRSRTKGRMLSKVAQAAPKNGAAGDRFRYRSVRGGVEAKANWDSAQSSRGQSPAAGRDLIAAWPWGPVLVGAIGRATFSNRTDQRRFRLISTPAGAAGRAFRRCSRRPDPPFASAARRSQGLAAATPRSGVFRRLRFIPNCDIQRKRDLGFRG